MYDDVGIFTIVGLDSVVRNICYKLFISSYFLLIVLKHGHGCTVRDHTRFPGHLYLQEKMRCKTKRWAVWSEKGSI